MRNKLTVRYAGGSANAKDREVKALWANCVQLQMAVFQRINGSLLQWVAPISVEHSPCFVPILDYSFDLVSKRRKKMRHWIEERRTTVIDTIRWMEGTWWIQQILSTFPWHSHPAWWLSTLMQLRAFSDWFSHHGEGCKC